MTLPNIRYYAKLTLCTAKDKATPKYEITECAGYYEPMRALIGANGKVSMYLLEKLQEGLKLPSIWLQAKNSLNFTGLKEYFDVEGKISGVAYGYPYQSKTYSSKQRTNPFWDYKTDGFLFVIGECSDEQTSTPKSIELIVLQNAKPLISSYCKMLQMGGFDATLQELRNLARDNEQGAM